MVSSRQFHKAAICTSDSILKIEFYMNWIHKILLFPYDVKEQQIAMMQIELKNWISSWSRLNHINIEFVYLINLRFLQQHEGMNFYLDTARKIKFSIKDFFSKCDQIRSFVGIWSHLLKKSLMENFIFCAVWMIKILEVHSEPCQISKMSDKNSEAATGGVLQNTCS